MKSDIAVRPAQEAEANGARPLAVSPTADVPALVDAPDQMITRRVVFQPANYAQLMELAEVFGRSGMYGIKSPAQAATLMMTAMELGISASQAFRAIHVIEGRPALSADLMMALCLSRHDVCEYFRCVQTDDWHAIYESKRISAPEPQVYTFTIEEAQRARLLGRDTWQKYPAQMLRARCISGLARMIYTDLMMGLYTPDEIYDARETPARREPDRERPPAAITTGGPQAESAAVPAGARRSVELSPAVLELEALLGAMTPEARKDWKAAIAVQYPESGPHGNHRRLDDEAARMLADIIINGAPAAAEEAKPVAPEAAAAPVAAAVSDVPPASAPAAVPTPAPIAQETAPAAPAMTAREIVVDTVTGEVTEKPKGSAADLSIIRRRCLAAIDAIAPADQAAVGHEIEKLIGTRNVMQMGIVACERLLIFMADLAARPYPALVPAKAEMTSTERALRNVCAERVAALPKWDQTRISSFMQEQFRCTVLEELTVGAIQRVVDKMGEWSEDPFAD